MLFYSPVFSTEKKNKAKPVIRKTAAAAAVFLSLTSFCACSNINSLSSGESKSSSHVHENGGVAIFFPSDGKTQGQNVPLNKWSSLAADLKPELEQNGFDKEHAEISTADSRSEQLSQVKKYLTGIGVKIDGSGQTDNFDGKSVILVISVANKNENSEIRRFGDYIPEENNSDPNSCSGSDCFESEMKNVLNAAKNAGIKIIEVGSDLDGFIPTMKVEMPSAYEIGQTQAQQIILKLNADAASESAPVSVEVLLPETQNESFDSQYFDGIWSIFKPYFQSGKMFSPSGLLTKDSTEDDKEKISYDVSKDSNVFDALTSRLENASKINGVEHAKLDALLTANDFAAREAIKTLKNMGYSGSSSSINPNLSISSIIESLRGLKDVNKSKVPAPAESRSGNSQDNSDNSDNSGNSDSYNKNSFKFKVTDSSKWPLVTGYGAYKSMGASIVNGSQWATMLENRKQYASGIANVCAYFYHGQSFSQIESEEPDITIEKASDEDILKLYYPLMVVSASNLKSKLIDSQYISAADAGL